MASISATRIKVAASLPEVRARGAQSGQDRSAQVDFLKKTSSLKGTNACALIDDVPKQRQAASISVTPSNHY